MGVIHIKNITKYYGTVCALNNLALTIEENKIYGLLGRNGAGKTTLLNLITNRLFPTEGEITVDNESVSGNDSALGKMFYMTEKSLYPEGMKVKDIFKWTKEFYPSFDREYAEVLCNKFELNLNKKVRSLSTGYSSIAKLITALASNAEILIFDEPVLGLDAHHRDLFYKELLANYIQKPKTIILSTHIIEEIADILERVIILKDRQVTVDDTVENLTGRAFCVSGPSGNVESYIKGRKCIHVDHLNSFEEATVMGEITGSDREQAKELNLELSKVKLQKLFVYLTGKGGEER